jgi:hypothetical protein
MQATTQNPNPNRRSGNDLNKLTSNFVLAYNRGSRFGHGIERLKAIVSALRIDKSQESPLRVALHTFLGAIRTGPVLFEVGVKPFNNYLRETYPELWQAMIADKKLDSLIYQKYTRALVRELAHAIDTGRRDRLDIQSSSFKTREIDPIITAFANNLDNIVSHQKILASEAEARASCEAFQRGCTDLAELSSALQEQIGLVESTLSVGLREFVKSGGVSNKEVYSKALEFVRMAQMTEPPSIQKALRSEANFQRCTTPQSYLQRLEELVKSETEASRKESEAEEKQKVVLHKLSTFCSNIEAEASQLGENSKLKSFYQALINGLRKENGVSIETNELTARLKALSGALSGLKSLEASIDTPGINIPLPTYPSSDNILNFRLVALTNSLNAFKSSLDTAVTERNYALNRLKEGLATIAKKLEELAKDKSLPLGDEAQQFNATITNLLSRKRELVDSFPQKSVRDIISEIENFKESVNGLVLALTRRKLLLKPLEDTINSVKSANSLFRNSPFQDLIKVLELALKDLSLFDSKGDIREVDSSRKFSEDAEILVEIRDAFAELEKFLGSRARDNFSLSFNFTNEDFYAQLPRLLNEIRLTKWVTP